MSLGEKPKNETEALEKDFIDLYRDLGKMKGWDDLTSRIIGILYLSPDPISMEELAKKTGYSLASISNKMKLLEPLGFITRRCKPGSKKCYFYFQKDFYKIMKDQFIKAQTVGFHMVVERVDVILDTHQDKVKSAEDKKRIKIIRDYRDQILRFEKTVKKIIDAIEKDEKDN